MAEVPEVFSPEGKRIVNFVFSRVCCHRHGQPFAKKWPAGYPVFACAGYEKYLAQPEILAQAKGDASDVPLIERLLDKEPMCCQLTRENLQAAYDKALESSPGLWARGKCWVCREIKDKTFFFNTGRYGRSVEKLCCFDCLYQLASNDANIVLEAVEKRDAVQEPSPGIIFASGDHAEIPSEVREVSEGSIDSGGDGSGGDKSTS